MLHVLALGRFALMSWAGSREGTRALRPSPSLLAASRWWCCGEVLVEVDAVVPVAEQVAVDEDDLLAGGEFAALFGEAPGCGDEYGDVGVMDGADGAQEALDVRAGDGVAGLVALALDHDAPAVGGCGHDVGAEGAGSAAVLVDREAAPVAQPGAELLGLAPAP